MGDVARRAMCRAPFSLGASAGAKGGLIYYAHPERSAHALLYAVRRTPLRCRWQDGSGITGYPTLCHIILLFFVQEIICSSVLFDKINTPERWPVLFWAYKVIVKWIFFIFHYSGYFYKEIHNGIHYIYNTFTLQEPGLIILSFH